MNNTNIDEAIIWCININIVKSVIKKTEEKIPISSHS